MTESRLKIVVVGGGSNAWTPTILRDMMLKPSLAHRCDFVLLDQIKERSDLVKAFGDKLAGELGVKSRIRSTTHQQRALRGADYIIIAISTGGLQAMKHDLAIPEKFGISSEPAGPLHSQRRGLHQSFADLLGSVLSIGDEFSGVNKD